MTMIYVFNTGYILIHFLFCATFQEDLPLESAYDKTFNVSILSMKSGLLRVKDIQQKETLQWDVFTCYFFYELSLKLQVTSMHISIIQI